MTASIVMISETLIERMARIVYTLVGVSLLPVLVGHLIWRGLRQSQYFFYWSERFIGLAVPRSEVEGRTAHAFADHRHQQVLWIHAVSVGETRAAAPLIERWIAKGSQYRVVLTHTTPTGRETGRSLFARFMERDPSAMGPRLVQRYLPYDLPWANGLFLSWARPTLGVLMETELWPNLLAAAQARGIPVVLINARLSPRSAHRLQQFASLARPAIRRLSGIAAQTRADAQGFERALGHALPDASLQIVGNMKFDITVPSTMLVLGQVWRKRIGARPVWVAASTRDDEELALLAAWVDARAAGRLSNDLLVIVPRHPQRFDRVAKLIENSGLRLVRRSVWDDNGLEMDVLLGDSLGEMFAYLQLADLVLIGGSIPDLGGQNPIEACAVGRPVFFGRHMFNFHQIARALKACQVGSEVADVGDWIVQGGALLSDPQAMSARSAAAIAFAGAHRGATVRTEAFLETILRAYG